MDGIKADHLICDKVKLVCLVSSCYAGGSPSTLGVQHAIAKLLQLRFPLLDCIYILQQENISFTLSHDAYQARKPGLPRECLCLAVVEIISRRPVLGKNIVAEQVDL